MPKHESAVYIGIDPGMGGGLASITLTSGKAKPDVENLAMPHTERDVWNGFRLWEPDLRVRYVYAVIEWINPAIYGIGKSQQSKLYGNYMQLRMALTAADIPFEDTKPRVWLRALGIPPRKKTENDRQWKNRLRAKAQQLYPKLKITLATADALLIATFCQRKHEGTLG